MASRGGGRHGVVAVHGQAGFPAADEDLVGVADRELELGDDPAARAPSLRSVDRVVDRDAAVGESVDLEEGEPEPRLPLVLPVGHGHAPGEAQLVVRVGRRRRLFPEHGEGRAHEVDDGGLEAPHVVPVTRGAEAFAERGRSADGESGDDGQGGGVDVEQGEGAVEDVVGPQPELARVDLALPREVSMRQFARLRRPRGAGREQQGRHVELVGVVRGRDRIVAGDQVLQPGRRLIRGAPRTIVVALGATDPTVAAIGCSRSTSAMITSGRGDTQGVLQLPSDEGGVQRDVQRAELGEGEPDDDLVAAVAHDQHDRVARADTHAGQPGRRRPAPGCASRGR